MLNGERAVKEIDALDWLGGTRSVMLIEEVVGLGSYGKTLTVLSADSPGGTEDRENDDFDEDHDLIESWTPRFRK